MIKKILPLILLFISCPASAAEVITDFSEKSTPILNEELRDIRDTIKTVEDSIPSVFVPTSTNALAGSVVQIVNYQTGAVATGTTTIPVDDSIPQNNEGDEYMTLAITPTSASNKLMIEVVAMIQCGGNGVNTGALFQGSTVNAIAATNWGTGATEHSTCILKHYMTAGTAASTTFKFRAGNSNAGTTTFNGGSTSREYGGVAASSITITEIKV